MSVLSKIEAMKKFGWEPMVNGPYEIVFNEDEGLFPADDMSVFVAVTLDDSEMSVVGFLRVDYDFFFGPHPDGVERDLYFDMAVHQFGDSPMIYGLEPLSRRKGEGIAFLL
jgi:hypothetical protein